MSCIPPIQSACLCARKSLRAFLLFPITINAFSNSTAASIPDDCWSFVSFANYSHLRADVTFCGPLFCLAVFCDIKKS